MTGLGPAGYQIGFELMLHWAERPLNIHDSKLSYMFCSPSIGLQTISLVQLKPMTSLTEKKELLMFCFFQPQNSNPTKGHWILHIKKIVKTFDQNVTFNDISPMKNNMLKIQ